MKENILTIKNELKFKKFLIKKEKNIFWKSESTWCVTGSETILW